MMGVLVRPNVPRDKIANMSSLINTTFGTADAQFPNMVTALHWPEPNDVLGLCQCFRQQHLRYRSSELGALLSVSEIRRNAVDLRRDLQSLSNESFMRFLESPECLNHMLGFHRGEEESFVNFIRSSIAAERHRTDQEAVDRGVWAPLGDYYCAPNSAAYHSPVIHNHFIVDCRSPFRRRPFEEVGAHGGLPTNINDPPSNDDDQLVVLVLDRAVSKLQAANLSTYHCVKSLIKVILIRGLNVRPGFTSVSARPYVGGTVLINPMTTGVTDCNLVTALIHEAIHNLLYRIENRFPLTDPIEAGYRIFVPSPWSGKRLRLSAYIHACYVYYALAMFWRQPAVREYFDTEGSNRQQELAEKGFENRLYLDVLAGCWDNVQPYVADELLALGSVVNPTGGR